MIISIIRTLLLYAFVILAIRLMGKRQISDMQPSELVVTLIVSDIAAIPMSNTSQPLLSGIIPVLVLIACEIIASIIMMKSRKFRGLICGSPITVIEDGKLMQNEMKRLRMSTEDLGKMTSVGVNEAGQIVASYSNGDTKKIGQIAVASFTNPSGLEKVGDNLYASTSHN